MIGFRHADARYPFLWEGPEQPAARWHAAGDGPVHYFCDTPDGAWAEFLRHEEITDPKDLATIRHALWAVDLGHQQHAKPDLPQEVLTGGYASYAACRTRSEPTTRIGRRRTGSPFRRPTPRGGARLARGWRPSTRRVAGRGRLRPVRATPDLIGWRATAAGQPDQALLAAVRPLE